MSAGYQLTAGQMKAIREVVRHYRSQIMGEVMRVGRQQVQADYYAKLNGNLAAATGSNFSTSSAPTASASVWVSNGSGGIEDSARDVTVVNRSDIAYVSGTHGIIRWIAGEWVFFGNCNPF